MTTAPRWLLDAFRCHSEPARRSRLKGRALLSCAGLVLALSATQALAIVQLTSTAMTCAQLKAKVSQAGAAIVRHQSRRVAGLPLYDRYVRDTQFCPGDDVTKFDTVPTSDTPSCALRKCVPFDFSPDGRR